MGTVIKEFLKNLEIRKQQIALSLLFGVKLDDVVLFDVKVDFGTIRQFVNDNAHVLRISCHPDGLGTCRVSIDCCLELLNVCVADLDLISCFAEIGRNVNDLAVDCEMTMCDKLTCFCTRVCKTCAIDDVIKSALEESEKIVAGYAVLLKSHLIIFVELAFENTVVSLGLLLCTCLYAVLRDLLAALTMIARCIRSAYECALFRIAAFAFEEKLLAFSAAESAN